MLEYFSFSISFSFPFPYFSFIFIDIVYALFISVYYAAKENVLVAGMREN